LQIFDTNLPSLKERQINNYSRQRNNMPVAFGINGFGRIGRLVFRAALDNPDVNVVAVNDPFLTLDYAAYQLKHDSVHGMLEKEVTVDNGCLVIGETRVQFFAERNPAGKLLDPSLIPCG
jgi:glyceraldehyde-3-phosphate dehydrogenase/erythrose-4-phosphate dehydrogenase